MPARPALSALTGARWVAALHVVFYHLGQGMLAPAPIWVRNVAAAGHVGVTLFFVLSGFVLAYTYFERAEWTARAFWWARLARVYPVYVLAFLLSAPHALKTLFASGVSPRSLATASASALMALTLTQAWVPAFALLWNIPAWSLSVEAFFYLLFPWLSAKLTRTPMPSGRLIVLATVTWAAGMVLPIAYLVCKPDGAAQPLDAENTGFWINLLKYSPLAHLPEFVVGAITGEIFLREVRRGARGAAPAPVLFTVIILGVLAISPSIPYPLLHNGLLTPLFAILIYLLARGRSVVAWFLALPPIVMLGEASYAVYLLHLQVAWSRRLFGALAPGVLRVPVLAFIGHVVPLTLACIAIFIWFESPIRAWLRAVGPGAGNLKRPEG
jgi:peptidoglycan/LPS O-acetylase OafA/YrhL